MIRWTEIPVSEKRELFWIYYGAIVFLVGCFWFAVWMTPR